MGFCHTNPNMKSIAITTLLFLLTSMSFSQQRPPFSEKTVGFEDRVFLPYTKGEVVRKINGPPMPVFDQICSIITAWDSIAPPQGIKVACYSIDNSLEIYFLPYLFEDGARFASEGGPHLSIFLNDPLQMFGSPIAPGIFLCPKKTATFYGYPIYQNDHQEVTIVCKKKIPFFISVSQEEYLKALIVKEEKNEQKNSPSDNQVQLQEMEQTYQKLLKIDKEAAHEFKQQMVEFTNKENVQEIDLVSLLKNELSGLTLDEKKRPAYYGGASAMEEYHNTSGLVPYENKEDADMLVRPNPALIDGSMKSKAQLLVICWSVGSSSTDSDKPRLYSEGRNGFHLADNLMSKLYHDQTIWSNIFGICN